MKKILIGVLIVIALIAAIVAGVFYWTADVTRAGNRFFTLIRDGNIKDAYQSTARQFQVATSQDQFIAFLKSSTIADYESSTWTSRSISNNIGELEGSLRTKGGGVVPVKVKLVKEDGEWKLLSIEKAAAGIVANTGSSAVPADNELIAMTNNSVVMLGRAINARNFTGFYSATSKIWQKQTTPDALKELLKSFIEQNIDLTIIDGKNPEFGEKPLIDESGRLIIKGFYLVQQNKVDFTLKYIQEEGQWKMIGVNVSQEEAPSSTKGVMPAEGELTALAHNAVSLLARAVSKDDFSEFYGAISKRWQAQTSREELRNAFGIFVEKKIPLTIIEGKKPEFTERPKLGDDGVLVLDGQYATSPFRVVFRLEFKNEESQWKLQSIDVKTKSD